MGWTVIHCRALSFLCCGLLFALAAPLTADDAPPSGGSGTNNQLEQLIEQLGSDRFAERREATRRVVEFGPEAVPKVSDAARSANRETQQRALLILKQFATNGVVPAREALVELAADSNAITARAASSALQAVVRNAIARLKQSGARLAFHGEDVDRVEASKGKLADDDLHPLLLLPTVRVLDLRHNPITNAGLDHLRNLTQLEECNLRGTQITDSGLAKLKHLTEMKSFSVEHTSVTDLGLQHLKKYRKLETLYIGGSEISGPGLESLAAAPINYLSLQGSEITDDAVPFIVKLKNLQSLGLDDTTVTDRVVPQIQTLTELKVLWLDRSNVSDESLENFMQMKQLTQLYLRGTRVTENGHEKLKAALPNTKIYFTKRKEEAP